MPWPTAPKRSGICRSPMTPVPSVPREIQVEMAISFVGSLCSTRRQNSTPRIRKAMGTLRAHCTMLRMVRVRSNPSACNFTCTVGNRRRNAPSRRGRKTSITVWEAAMCTACSPAATRCTSRKASLQSASMLSAYLRRTSPAGESLAPRFVRVKSCVPKSASSEEICWLTFDTDILIWRAASVSCPSRATARNTMRRGSSRVPSSRCSARRYLTCPSRRAPSRVSAVETLYAM